MSGMGKPTESKRKAELRKMGKDELKACARKCGIKPKSKENGKSRTLKKAELIDAVMSSEYKKSGGSIESNVEQITKTLQNVGKTKSTLDAQLTEAPPGVSQVAKSDGTVSASGKPNKRADIVRKIMKEKSLSMIDASKYVKQHKLY
jgi:ribosomal protein L25 (general stress protein Ctc)